MVGLPTFLYSIRTSKLLVILSSTLEGLWPSRSPDLPIPGQHLKPLRFFELEVGGLWLGRPPDLPAPSLHFKPLPSSEHEIGGLVAQSVSQSLCT